MIDKEKIKEIVNKKSFHVILLSVIILILLFILGIVALEYNENGEKNMPFIISKISVISTSEGIDKTSEGNKWAFDINQNNDLYIYIEKNKNYDKSEIIQSVVFDNFIVDKKSDIGEIKIFKPDATSESQIFTSKEENVENIIEYTGETESNFKNLKILNQGDVLALRVSNTKVGSYESNEEEEINHGELLKKAGLTLDDLKGNLKFDITINLSSGKSFKGTISIDIPTGDIIENSTTNLEITDFSNVAFKRVKN